MEKQDNNKTEEKANTDIQETKKTRKTRKFIVLIFLILATIVTYIIFRGEYLETLELGEKYINIFWQNLSNRVITFGVIFISLYFIIYITNTKMKKGLKPFFEEEKKTMPKMPNKSIAFILSVILSFLITNLIMEKFMLFINATAFEITDPVLGYDIGYFIFGQPFIKTVIQYLLALTVGLTIYIVFYYIITFNICFDGVNRETLKKSSLINQLCKNVVLISIFLAGYIFIETHNVGLQRFLNLKEIGNYALYGAGISEVTIKLWGYRVLGIIITLSILFVGVTITLNPLLTTSLGKKLSVSNLLFPASYWTFIPLLVPKLVDEPSPFIWVVATKYAKDTPTTITNNTPITITNILFLFFISTLPLL